MTIVMRWREQVERKGSDMLEYPYLADGSGVDILRGGGPYYDYRKGCDLVQTEWIFNSCF